MVKEIQKIQKQNQVELEEIQEEIAEELFWHNFQDLMKTRGIKLYNIQNNVKDLKGIKYDVVGANDEYVVILKIKVKFRKKDISNFMKKQLITFQKSFSYYKKHKVIGCVAGLVIDRRVKLEAFNCGLFVFTPKGKNGAAIANEPMFKPVVF